MENKTFKNLIRKYCKLVARQLYNLDIEIYFKKDLGYVGVFRNIDNAPAFCDTIKKMKEWDKNPITSITFDDLLFNTNCWINDLDRCWDYMLHEITHQEVGVFVSEKWRISHPPKFYTALRRNKRKVEDLKTKFFQETK